MYWSVIVLIALFVVVIISVAVSRNHNSNVFEEIDKKNRVLPENFEISKIIEFEYLRFFLDLSNKQIAVSSDIDEPYSIVKFNKILDCSIVLDESVVCNVKGNIAGAVAGGLLFGGIGAIAGNNTSQSYTTTKSIRSLIVRLKVDDILKPVVDIVVVDRIIRNREEEYTKAFQVAEEIYSTIDLAIKKTSKVKK